MNMRGFVYMLESVFAGLILVGFMLYLAGGHSQGAQGQDFSSVLPELEQQGILRPLVYSGDLQAIDDMISLPGFSHAVRVCDPLGSCTGQPPSGTIVKVYSIILAGEDSLEPREVKLYAWQA
jgi:hypothetical protein